ncbi:AAA family ATPase [Seohaeicola saemankumensis]|nr:AAA family ATPase [Seohaeicola saemankumensis]MCA0873017.1 AAA family ATPase [Seohaeicola saemankumensis]
MRLTRLDLTRYGKFTDASLSFGPRPAPGQPDLHVIYGPNEAGKSTFLSAWLDLLFQIPTRSTMGFLHPYASMQIGATLEIDGTSHNLVRIKKRDHALLDAQGSPLGEALIHGGLRRLDRDAYTAMFSLNRQTLDEGGESILASEGDLGELLFQASAGLTDLAMQLAALRDKADEFLNATGRKGELRELHAACTELEKEIKTQDTAASEFSRLSDTRDAALNDWQKARETATATQAELAALERLGDALPLAQRLTRLQQQIDAFDDLPAPPESWLDELAAFDRAETEIATRKTNAKRMVQDLQRDLTALQPDDSIFEVEGQIDAAETLKSAHDTARADLPRRQSEQQAEQNAIRDCLNRLNQSRSDANSLLLPAAATGRLRGLIERHSGIDMACAAAEDEHRRAVAEHDLATAQLTEIGGAQTNLGGLGHLVQQIRRDDPQGALDRETRQLELARTRLDAALSDLSPWTGSGHDLAVQSCPDANVLNHLEREISHAERSAERDAEQQTRLNREIEQAERRQHSAENTGSVSLSEAAHARTRREAAWRDHRAALDPETADRFEEAMRLDDQIGAALSEHRAKAASAAEAAQALAEKRHEAEAATKAAEGSAARVDALNNRLRGYISAAAPQLPDDMTLGAFRSWLARREQALEAHEHHEQALRGRAHAETHVQRSLADLQTALTQAGHALPSGASLSVALETAQSLLDRAAEITALRRTAGAAQQDVQRREQDLKQADKARDAWRQEWNRACADTWLADAPLDVSEMRAILEELGVMQSHVARLGDLDRRVRTMEDNRDAFDRAVRALAEQLGMAADAPVRDLWHDVTSRLRDAQAMRARRSDLQQRLDRALAEQAEIDTAAQIHSRRTAEFAEFFATVSWPETRAALIHAGKRAQLERTRATLVDDICTLMRCADLEQALAQLGTANHEETEGRIAALKADLETHNSEREEAHTALRHAERAIDAIGGDGAVARLEERRQTLLLEIEDRARQHLRLRLGALAVDNALRRYRDTHRSDMMQRASDAFSQMTGNRYTGLAAQPDGQREVLVALAAQGGSKEAAQLSEGTRAQLYLALRIAGYHEFLRSNGPVPFVADDIMESFDDTRAKQTFALLGDMARSGQVIYLTHHEHLYDIARAACPEVQIHELSN